MHQLFNRMANKTSAAVGSAWSFMAALGIIILWLVTGPLFKFSGTWQLIINTGTTIVTFLLVFLIQNSQNRNAELTQLKLDEILRVTEKARNSFLNLEELTEEEISLLRSEFNRICEKRDMGEHDEEVKVLVD